MTKTAGGGEIIIIIFSSKCLNLKISSKHMLEEKQ